MIVIFALPTAILALALLCGAVCEHTPVGDLIDRLLTIHGRGRS